MKTNVGQWYSVRGRGQAAPEIRLREDIVDRPVSLARVALGFQICVIKLPAP